MKRILTDGEEIGGKVEREGSERVRMNLAWTQFEAWSADYQSVTPSLSLPLCVTVTNNLRWRLLMRGCSFIFNSVGQEGRWTLPYQSTGTEALWMTLSQQILCPKTNMKLVHLFLQSTQFLRLFFNILCMEKMSTCQHLETHLYIYICKYIYFPFCCLNVCKSETPVCEQICINERYCIRYCVSQKWRLIVKPQFQ